MFADAAKLADPAKGVTGIEGPTLDTFLSMLYEYGGQLYDDPVKPTKSLVNSPAGIKAMTLWSDAMKSGAAKPIPARNKQSRNRDSFRSIFASRCNSMKKPSRRR